MISPPSIIAFPARIPSIALLVTDLPDPDSPTIASVSPLSRSKERDEVNKFVNQLKIKLPSIDRAVKYLSGGNQQKVVFAKWLMRGSNVYIFDEPTRGIDIGAKTEVYKIINSLAEAGNAVIVISSELPEVLGVSDRVAVFREGRIVKFLDIKDATQEKIMFYAMGGVDNETA